MISCATQLVDILIGIHSVISVQIAADYLATWQENELGVIQFPQFPSATEP